MFTHAKNRDHLIKTVKSAAFTIDPTTTTTGTTTPAKVPSKHQRINSSVFSDHHKMILPEVSLEARHKTSVRRGDQEHSIVPSGLSLHSSSSNNNDDDDDVDQQRCCVHRRHGRRRRLSICSSNVHQDSRSQVTRQICHFVHAILVVTLLLALSSSSSSSSSQLISFPSAIFAEAKKGPLSSSASPGAATAGETGAARTKQTPTNLKNSKSIQRIKQEFKTAIQDNIAYDWLRQERILPKKKRKSKKENETDAKKLQGEDTEMSLIMPQLTALEVKHRDETNSHANDDITSGGSSSTTSPINDTDDFDDHRQLETVDDKNAKVNEQYDATDIDDDDRDVCLGPLTDNIYHWHFSFRGAAGSVYEHGLYHGRMILPKDFPFGPPKVQLWTPSGRFKTFYDICLSASHFHPESWTPQWTIPSLVQALRLHMLTSPNEIGGIHSSTKKTLELAHQSWTWSCSAERGRGKNKSVLVIDHDRLVKQGAITRRFIPKSEEINDYDDESITTTTLQENENDNITVAQGDEAAGEGTSLTSNNNTDPGIDSSRTKRKKKKKDSLDSSIPQTKGLNRSDHRESSLLPSMFSFFSSRPILTRSMIILILLFLLFRPQVT